MLYYTIQYYTIILCHIVSCYIAYCIILYYNIVYYNVLYYYVADYAMPSLMLLFMSSRVSESMMENSWPRCQCLTINALVNS